MEYFKRFLKKLGLLILILVILLLLFPTQISEAYNILGAVFGPLIFIILVVSALPSKKSK